MKRKEFLRLFRAEPGKKGWLQDHDPAWVGTPEMKKLGEETLKGRAHQLLAANLEALSASQQLLYASDRYSVLIIFQAMDAAGKDGTIRHVMSGVNPQGCQVFSFKKPSDEELDHNFLWRYMRSLPERGRFGIFNRSYYEDVLVVKVHPELLEEQKLPEAKSGKDFWQERYEDINSFERHLFRNGTVIIKLFLNLSKDAVRFLRLRYEKVDQEFPSTSAAVLKCILATAARASRPPLSAIFLAASLTEAETPRGRRTPTRFPAVSEPVDEFLAGENGGSGDGVVRFGLGSLVKDDVAALFHQGSLKHANVSELVGKGARTFRPEGAEIFDDAGVSPSEQAIEIADFLEKRVVAVGSDGDDALRCAGLADGGREVADALVG